MHNDIRIVEARIARVLNERLEPAQYAEHIPLDLQAWHVPDEPVPVAEALRASYEPFSVGTPWGRPWSTLWLRATGTVPDDWADRHIEAVFDLGFVGDWPGGQAEALVYDAHGQPIKGIAPQNQYVPVARAALGGEHVCLLLEAAANPDILADGMRPTPLGDKSTAGEVPLYTLKRADLAVLDVEVWQLTLDLRVLTELMAELPETEPRRHEILRGVERTLDAIDLADLSGSAAAARAMLAPLLARPANASAHRISAAGHAHIDSAWLWPLRETKRKTARTFANVTALAQDYPELVFACSQAQQYAWVKSLYPQIYAQMQEAARAGQWAPVGGMWVEADGNLPGGEALARQLIHGKRFFIEEFGVDCRGVWLPDSFGYTAAYPQLAKLAGMSWFLTQKISWNQTNRFPHHTFWWEGIDGSRIFTHFPPADTYNGTLEGSELALAAANYSEKGRGTRSLQPFGHGDGGGGPTREMLERARRVHDLEGSPRVTIEHPDRFFAEAEAEYPDAPVWSGELYLELHRGTFTSQQRIKAGNRRSEHLLREAELWATTAAVSIHGWSYPYKDLDRLWKEVLLNQFHDILPGSSIAWVHREAEATYARIADDLETIIAGATRALRQSTIAAKTAHDLWAFNVSPRPRREVALVPAALASSAPKSAQTLGDGRRAALVDVPASGVAVMTVSTGDDAADHVAPVRVEGPNSGSGHRLDNGLVSVRLGDDGTLASVVDLATGREVIPAGLAGNLLQLHADLPNSWDAWDVDRHYLRQVTNVTALDSIEIIEEGPLLGAVRIVRSFGASRLVQTVTLRAGSRRIDIENELDWHEREKLLKASFPLDLQADRATSEIQFGHVHRPTHVNTSWEFARFEVYAHRWVHVGEPGFGVGLITDATYGHDAMRSTGADGAGTTTTVRLSLVRAPRSPDPEADQGPHRFTYSLLPGVGLEQTIAEGYALNLPIRVVPGGEGPCPEPLIHVTGIGPTSGVDDRGATVEAVKLADDRSGDVIIRLYESLGGRARATLSATFPVSAVEIVDLLERPLAGAVPLALDAGRVDVSLRPFQVVTLRWRRA
jgi:alpha-mannosidase